MRSPEFKKNEIADLGNMEIRAIHNALNICQYNQQAAADALGIHRDALSRKMKKYNISISRIEGQLVFT